MQRHFKWSLEDRRGSYEHSDKFQRVFRIVQGISRRLKDDLRGFKNSGSFRAAQGVYGRSRVYQGVSGGFMKSQKYFRKPQVNSVVFQEVSGVAWGISGERRRI